MTDRKNQIKPFLAGKEPVEDIDTGSENSREQEYEGAGQGARDQDQGHAMAPGLEGVIRLYDSFLKQVKLGDDSHNHGVFSNLVSSLKGHYSQEFIQEFLDYASAYDELENFVETGTFLSGLLGKRDSDNVTLKMGYKIPIANIVNSLNKGYLKIEGDVGDGLGRDGGGGSIHIEGNAGNFVGRYMHDGLIEITGNAKSFVGYKMHEGAVRIRGNVEECLGNGMSGGEIIIGGGCGDKLGAEMTGGKILVEGTTCVKIGELMTGGVIEVKGRSKGVAISKIGGGMKGGEIILKTDMDDVYFKKYKIADTMEGGKIWNNGKIVVLK
ncbi:MAG TPA: hypothetical protein HA282_00195 [Nanoarchaeota archaeon]|nr:hypothetical protein [Candidatus Pacearchaeota archaeon]HIH17889.1 hypothetical protein [Nanoarchaeota archaeon]HIH33741.1 hypothetical protein [Nanoarchaeota archaeon]HIH51330.1 hypothetical protein [Nanoarchaeota archaeon]HIH65621.1 hypothetical protein [Nanoarchaeota archaeon]